MKISHFFAYSSLLLVLASCANTVELTTRFDASQAAYILEQGTGTIKGQAFLKTRGGDLKTAAGNMATLVPVTAYSTERFRAIYGDSKVTKLNANFKDTDPRYKDFIRQVSVDIEGRFTFTNVAAGNYYVTTSVIWEAPGYGGYLAQQGGALYNNVSVEKGKTVEIILSGF